MAINRKRYEIQARDKTTRQLKPMGGFSELKIGWELRKERHSTMLNIHRAALHETESVVIDEVEKRGERRRIQNNIDHETAIKDQRAESLKTSNESAKIVADIAIERNFDITKSHSEWTKYIDSSDMEESHKDFHLQRANEWTAKLLALNEEISDNHLKSVQTNAEKIFNDPEK